MIRGSSGARARRGGGGVVRGTGDAVTRTQYTSVRYAQDEPQET